MDAGGWQYADLLERIPSNLIIDAIIKSKEWGNMVPMLPKREEIHFATTPAHHN